MQGDPGDEEPVRLAAPSAAEARAERFGARCATHPEVAAVATCARCGTYVCQPCVGHADDAGSYCAACAPRVRSVLVPWEDDTLTFGRRVIDTTRLLVREPARVYGRMRSGSPGRAVLFAAFGGLVQGVVMGVLLGGLFGCLGAATSFGGGPDENTQVSAIVAVTLLFASPVVLVSSALVYVGLIFVPYHLTARALGGQGGAGESLRAASYTQVLQLVLLPFMVLQQIPIIGLLISLMVVSYALGYVCYALYHHGIGVHRLEGGAAIAAAAAPVVTVFGLSILFLALAVALAVFANAPLL